MTSITLLLTEPGRISVEAGHVDFYAIPVEGYDDFICRPSGLISLEDAQAVASELAQQVEKGRISRYRWHKDN